MHYESYPVWMLPFFLLISGALFILLPSCKSIEPPELQTIKQIRVEARSINDIDLMGTAVFYNPNQQKLILKEGFVEVFLAGEKVGTIDKIFDLALPARDTFEVPLDLTLSAGAVGAVLESHAIQLLMGEKLPVRYTGFIRAKAYGIVIRIPVDQRDDIKLKL